MKVLVTGATGFLGSYVVPELLKEGHQVVAAVRASSDTSRLKGVGVELRNLDLGDRSTMAAAVAGVDAVVHLAAYYTFMGEKEKYEKLNVKATDHLVQTCIDAGVGRFAYCSTTEAIGPVEGIGDEDSSLNPEYEYGRSKARAEQVVRAASDQLEHVILRPSGIYGPRNVDDVSYWFITSYGRSMATKFIVGTGKNTIQFVHAYDVARGFALALRNWETAKGHTYIITDRRAYSYEEVYAILGDITGIPSPRHHLPAWLAMALIAPVEAWNRLRGRNDFLMTRASVRTVVEDRAYSIGRAVRDLGYDPRYDLRTGLQETVDWYRQNGHLPAGPVSEKG